MPIDPERMKSQRGGEAQQINVRLSDEANAVVDYLIYTERAASRGAWLVDLIKDRIEEAAPSIQKSLDSPDLQQVERLAEVKQAIDILVPPETP